jgi:hypothetical protein
MIFEVLSISGKFFDSQLSCDLDEIRFDADFIQTLQEPFAFVVDLPHDENVKVTVMACFSAPERPSSVKTSLPCRPDP